MHLHGQARKRETINACNWQSTTNNKSEVLLACCDASLVCRAVTCVRASAYGCNRQVSNGFVEMVYLSLLRVHVGSFIERELLQLVRLRFDCIHVDVGVADRGVLGMIPHARAPQIPFLF